MSQTQIVDFDHRGYFVSFNVSVKGPSVFCPSDPLRGDPQSSCVIGFPLPTMHVNASQTPQDGVRECINFRHRETPARQIGRQMTGSAKKVSFFVQGICFGAKRLRSVGE